MPLTNDDLAQLLSELAETQQFKFLDQLMQHGESMQDEPDGDEMGAEFGAEEQPPVAEAATDPGDDDLGDVQDLLVDEGGEDEELPPEEGPPAEAPPEESAPEEAPPEEEEPEEKNYLPAAAMAGPVGTGLAAAGRALTSPGAIGAAGGFVGGRMSKRSQKATGNQPVRYAQLRDAHNRLVQEHGRLATRMQSLLREKADAERSAVLQAMARKYPDFIDVNSELNTVLYSRKSTMDDAAFQAHCATVEKYAQKAAMVARTQRGDIPQGFVDRQPQDAETEKYAARLSQEAVRIYTDSLSSGKQLTYDEAKQEAAKRLK